MRFIALHSDFIEIKPVSKALKTAKEIPKEMKRFEECLVVLTSIEKEDEETNIAKKAVKEITNIAEQVKTKNIVLYPWVHLSSKPSSPNEAQRILKEMADYLYSEKYTVENAPFGWYKAFTVSCKGHPLSELSREIYAKEGKEKEDDNESLKQESKKKSEFFILTPKGEEIKLDDFDFSKHNDLKKFAKYEKGGNRADEGEPPHIKLMKEHGIADYEPGSDSGNIRWYPKGTLMKRLLEREITKFCVDYGAMEVETPIMYDFEHPTLKKYLNRFPARQYNVLSDNKKFFLRFAACFGMFLMAHDTVMSYKNLPLRMVEITRYSFRREQRGELSGLKRLRAFTMPDMHTFCRTIDSSKEEFDAQFRKSIEFLEISGIKNYEAAFRVQNDFYNENKEWYISMVKELGRPVLLELFDIRYAYFITKFEFNFVDAFSKAAALSTVQIDVENADTYDISYIDSDGSKKRPYILHASISGAIERIIYALLEQEYMQKQGKPMFPVWLSPTQIRIIPISEEQNEYCLNLLKDLEKENIRIDIDDTNESLGKRVRNAEKEWIPYVIVIGENEIKENILAVNIRNEEKKKMKKEELVKEVQNKTRNRSFIPLNMSKNISIRPLL